MRIDGPQFVCYFLICRVLPKGKRYRQKRVVSWQLIPR